MPASRTFRIGTGAGFSSDRLDPAVDLVEHGELDAIVFECVGERTLAFGHRDRQANPDRGYNPLLERRMRVMLPLCRRHGTRLITNMGVANPLAAAELTARIAGDLGLSGLKVAALLGDDVTNLINADAELLEPGCTLSETGRQMIGANAYLGSDAILQALETGADVIITGRVADPSLFLAPLCQHFGWDTKDWPTLGAGTMVGHLMECAAQVTGGYFADPGYKDVNNLAYVGFPLAEVEQDGSAVITKLEGTGGCVDTRTVREQLLYEVHDPTRYLTPDVTADFSQAALQDDGADRVRIGNANGRPRPENFKVTVAFDGGFLAEAEVSYAGPGAQERARLAGDIVRERIARVHGSNAPMRIDLIGASSLHASALDYPTDSRDIRLRCAMRASSREEADNLLWEVESLLCCGPAGGGGYRGHVTPSVMTYSTFLDRTQVRTSVEVFEA
jgi:hypothetical protein